MASSSSTAAQEMKKCDVFVSFHGEDTRNNFISTLQGGLRNRAIDCFIDDNLNRGNEVWQSLMNTIEGSTISVVVFSEGYASSRWCLDELVKIMVCKETQKQVVLPVFYHVDPSHVRNQTTDTTFGDGFAELVDSFDEAKLERLKMTEEEFRFKQQSWRKAMTAAANISGRTSEEERRVYQLAENVVRDVLEILNYITPGDNKELVGVQPIIENIEDSLNSPSRYVQIIGLWGMGGIGKTTIANTIFNKMRSKFEGSFFARNVREESRSPNGLSPMQKELLSAILKDPNFSMNFGFPKLRLGRKKVFIVFDDVTSLNQIQFLIQDINCFGPGSRVIITTRDRHVLINCRVDNNNIYKIEGLCHQDALRLFCWYAFGQNRPNVDYDKLSNDVVLYAKGVPLALKVLGSLLSHKPTKFWSSAIERLKIIPHQEIQKVLQVSYDELDDLEKKIFLDIACFFKWESKDFVIEFFEACRFYPEYGIDILIDRCLITISDNNKIAMHDLLQEMGWEIVRKESTNDPGQRSRLWHHEDIYDVLENNEGTTGTIEGMCLDMSKEGPIIQLQPDDMARMCKLRYLKLHNSHNEENNINKVHVSQSLQYVSTKLRYLCWHGCPLEPLMHKNFCSRYLVALDIPHSNIEQFGIDIEVPTLKHVDLSHSKRLRKILDLSFAPNLETLILEGCKSLSEISLSIQYLDKLVILNLKHCKRLHSLPTGVLLESLRKLFLSGCSNLKIFDPNISFNIEELYLDETAITVLPPSIENLSRVAALNLENCTMLESLPSNIFKLESIQYLNLSGCSKLGWPNNPGKLLEAFKVLTPKGLVGREELDRKGVLSSSLTSFPSMKELNLSNCGITELPSNLDKLSLLERLLLGKNNFRSIPTSIINLAELSYLDLSYCKRLESLPQLPSRLRSLDAHSCTSLLRAVAFGTYLSRCASDCIRLDFSNCFRLRFDIEIGILIRAMYMERRRSTCILLLREATVRSVFLSRTKTCKICEGESSITFVKKSFHYRDGLSLATVVEFRNYHNDGQGLVVRFDLRFGDEFGRRQSCSGTMGCWDRGAGPDIVNAPHVFLGYGIPLTFSESLLGKIEEVDDCTISIQFFVENLNGERSDCCNVIRCVFPLA